MAKKGGLHSLKDEDWKAMAKLHVNSLSTTDDEVEMYDPENPPLTQPPVSSQESQYRQPSDSSSYYNRKHAEIMAAYGNGLYTSIAKDMEAAGASKSVESEEDLEEKVKCSLGLSDSMADSSGGLSPTDEAVAEAEAINKRHLEAKCLEKIYSCYRNMKDAVEKCGGLANDALGCNSDWHDAIDDYEKQVGALTAEVRRKLGMYQEEVNGTIKSMHREAEGLKLEVHQTLERLKTRVDERTGKSEVYMLAVETVLDDLEDTMEAKINAMNKRMAQFHTSFLKRLAAIKVRIEHLEDSIPEQRRLMEEAKMSLRRVNAQTADFIDKHFKNGDGE